MPSPRTMSAPHDPTYDVAAAEAAAAAAIADAAAAGSGAPHPPVPPSPIVPAAASHNNANAKAKEATVAEAAEDDAEAAPLPAAVQILPAVPPTAPRYADADLHRHDVLSGRGGFVNAHPGNHHLRALCQYRKKEWDDGNNATKRRIAIEIYGMIRKLNPPGRFLKKEIVPGGGTSGGKGGGGGSGNKQASKEEAETTSATATAAAVAAEVIAGAAPTDSAEASAAAAAAIAAGDSETASAILAPNVLAAQQAKAQQANAPWVELNEEKSIQKAMQVMRDYKRPDRRERDNKPGKRKRSNLPRGGGVVVGGGAGGAGDDVGAGVGGVAGGTPNSQADGYDEQMREQHVEAAALAEAYEAKGSGNAADDAAAAAAAGGNEVLPQADANVYAEGCTNGIIPTNVDVLTGRGAFINDHPGNKYWRTLAKQGKARFDAGDQTDKKEVAMEIVRAVTNQTPTGGRFLRKIDPTPATGKKGKAARAFALTPRGFQGPWEVMDEAEARVKTIQTLRDMGRDKSKNKKRRTSAPPSASKPAPAAAMPELPPVGAGAAQEPDYTKPLAEDMTQQQQQMVTNPVMVGDEHAAV